MKIFGSSGKAAAGKTTFAEHAIKTFGGTKIALADALKEEVAAFLTSCCVDFREENLYGTSEFKDQAFAVSVNDWLQTDYRPRRVLNPHMGISPEGLFLTCTYRRLMQLWGTEYRRAQDSDYWVKKTKEKLLSTEGLVFIDDVRFESEAQLVHDLGGVLVRITRPGQKALDHESETALDGYRDFNWLVMNCGGLDDFKAETERCLRVML